MLTTLWITARAVQWNWIHFAKIYSLCLACHSCKLTQTISRCFNLAKNDINKAASQWRNNYLYIWQ